MSKEYGIHWDKFKQIAKIAIPATLAVGIGYHEYTRRQNIQELQQTEAECIQASIADRGRDPKENAIKIQDCIDAKYIQRYERKNTLSRGK